MSDREKILRKALSFAGEVIQLHPKIPNGYIYRSMAYLAKGEKAKGLGDWITAMSLQTPQIRLHCSHKPDSLRLGCGFGFGSESEGPLLENDSDRRIAACTKRLARDPKNLAAYYERACSYARKDQFNKAIADYDEIIRLDPEDAEASRERGLVHHIVNSSQKQHEMALPDYDAALRLDPRIDWAYAFRGWIYGSRGEYARAIAEYSQAMRLSPFDADLYSRRAWIYVNKRDYAGAIEDFRKATALHPDDNQAHVDLAWYLATCPDAGQRNGKEARNHAELACKATSWRESAYLHTLAAACAECGDFEQAVKWQTKAVELAAPAEKMRQTQRLELYRTHIPYHMPTPLVSTPLSSK